MQLKILAARLFALLLLIAVVSPASTAHADVEAATRLTVFREPGKKNAGITVLHPQTDVSAQYAGASIAAGYEVDSVSGATARVFGGVDAVTSATRFSDLRQAAKASVGWNVADIGLQAGYSYGWESDYISHTLQVAARGDFLEKNFTLGLSYTRNFDSVCDANNNLAQGALDRKSLTSSDRCFESKQTETLTRSVDIHTFEPVLSWTATPKLLLQFGATLQLLDGFQSNPYRRVLVGSQGRTPQEHVPQQRQRYALFTRANYAVPAMRAAFSLNGRAYRDSWDVLAATGDAWFTTYLADALLFGVHGRYHKQTGAVFYRNAPDLETLGPAGSYWTGDRELSPLGTITTGIKISYLRTRRQKPDAWLDELEVNMKADGMFYRAERFSPSDDRKLALIIQAGLMARF